MEKSEYYCKFQKKTQETSRKGAKPQPQPPDITYRANSFTINLYEGWQDKTVYTITAL